MDSSFFLLQRMGGAELRFVLHPETIPRGGLTGKHDIDAGQWLVYL